MYTNPIPTRILRFLAIQLAVGLGCAAQTASMSLSSATGSPGSAVTLDLTVDAGPSDPAAFLVDLGLFDGRFLVGGHIGGVRFHRVGEDGFLQQRGGRHYMPRVGSKSNIDSERRRGYACDDSVGIDQERLLANSTGIGIRRRWKRGVPGNIGHGRGRDDRTTTGIERLLVQPRVDYSSSGVPLYSRLDRRGAKRRCGHHPDPISDGCDYAGLHCNPRRLNLRHI